MQSCQVSEFPDSSRKCQSCSQQCLQFIGATDAYVAENASLGSIILTANVTDKRDLNRELEYAIVSGNHDSKFSINSSSGDVYLVGNLDFEDISVYSLKLVVADISEDPPSSESATTTVTINIIDYNDNRPVFKETEYVVQVDEDVDVGSTVITVEATDLDSGSNALIQYLLFGSDKFGISSDGEVFTLSELDFEQQREHNVSIEAKDGGTPALSSTILLTIRLKNVNDERPYFTTPNYTASLSETINPGTFVLAVNATDKDTPVSDLTYELVGTLSFTIDSTGAIRTSAELDYELLNVHTFNVVVSDGPPNTDPMGTSAVVVMITDSNDNPPVFPYTEDTITVSILEDIEINSTVFNASATDKDSGENGLLKYKLDLNSKKFFSITDEGLLKIDASLDRESISLHSVLVTATDSGLPQLSSEITVNVSVEDVNDNAPQFESGLTSFTISESQPVNSTIVVLKAKDADTGSNALLQYSLQSAADIPFSVSNDLGVLFVSSDLDYETIESYTITVLVEDSGHPFLSDMKNISINITDENDNSPMFSAETLKVNVSEDAEVGMELIQLTSTDADSGVNSYTEYFIQSGDDQYNRFTVNSTTGWVYVSESLNYEEQSDYELVILANNTLSNIPLTSTTHLIIKLEDVNEFVPEFEQDVYMFSVLEEQPIGYLVAALSATDNDTGSAGESVYEILPANSPFTVANGELVTTSVLNRESVDYYEVVITATNTESPFYSANATIILNVEDVNDNAPVFSATLYKAFLPEDSPSGTSLNLLPPLAVSDIDSEGPNSKISYSIKETTLFSIDSSTGVILLVGSLDYEVKPSLEFLITANDSGVPSLISEASISVSVGNTNDNSPTLSNFGTVVTYTEGSGMVSLAPSTNITDKDELPLESITVRLVDENKVASTLPDSLSFSYPIKLDSSLTLVSNNNDRTLIVLGSLSPSQATSILRTVQFRNDEDEPEPTSRYFQVTLFDGIHTVTSNLLEVKINLINDNVPTLSLDTSNEKGNFETQFLEEGSPVSITSTNVDIEDMDETSMASLTLEVILTPVPDSDSEGLQVSSSLLNQFNVTYSSNNHTLLVSGTNSFQSWEQILMGISYYNSRDEPTVYPDRLVQFVLSDADYNSLPVNATISITLVNDYPLLNLGNDVDYEATFVEGRGHVALTSQDGFQLKDADNSSLYNASITLLNPLDGDNERIVVPSSDAVAIEQTNHTILITGIANISVYAGLLSNVRYFNDRLIPSSTIRQVLFTVSDGELVSSATTYVSFSFVNDPPIVDLNGASAGLNYALTFVEDSSPVLAFSSSLTVHDVDSTTLDHATITLIPTPASSAEGISVGYSNLVVTGNSSHISISGSASPLDYQNTLRTLRYYNDIKEPIELQRTVTVTISDGEQTSDEVNSTITIQLMNDLPLVVLGVSSTTYLEESAEASLTRTPRISDDDNTTMASMSVTLEGVVDGNLEVFQYNSLPEDEVLVEILKVDTETFKYVFTSVSPLGYADFAVLLTSFKYKHLSLEPTAGVRTLSVEVSDGLDSSQSSQVSINVTLKNDNAPVIKNDLVTQASISENMVDVIVFTISADDDDSSTGPYASHGQIIYSIVGGNDEEMFQLDPSTGVLTLVKAVDREETAILPLLTISASNPAPLDGAGTFPSIFVLISVLDRNDMSPQWVDTPYTFEIPENSSSKSVVGSVSAEDGDIGSNADISYSIITGDSGFEIESTSGVISVASSAELDRETTPMLTFSVQAADGGTPSLVNTTTVSIKLTDLNDNKPNVSPLIEAEVLESIEIGEVFFTVTANDPDNGVNGSLRYVILNSVPFGINETSGELYSIQKLDRESNNSFTIDIAVSDQGIVPLISTTTVIVSLLDVNDNPPIFSELEYYSTLQENEPIGQLVLLVTASDNDAGNNSAIEFSLSSNVSDFFSIDTVSGEIKNLQVFDRETTDMFTFNVFAADKGDPQFTATATVKVSIKDVNDNPPVFSLDLYKATISEDTPTPFSFLNISATDLDSSTQNITFLIKDSEFSSQFVINPMTGLISVVQAVDREQTDSVVLLVEASDNGPVPLTSVAEVVIVVEDINDNIPVFDSVAYNLTVTENTSGEVIGAVKATDSDFGDNGKVSYHFLTFDEALPFKVNNTSGDILVTTPLDREEIGDYTFLITAQDGGTPPLNSTATVYVTVLDINDNSPQFRQDEYEAMVSEDHATLTPFLSIEATDLDLGVNSKITYSISSENSKNQFRIDPESGNLSLLSPLDAETELTYILNVTARDNGSPVLSTVLPVYITVLDVNDNKVSIQLSQSLIKFTEEGENIGVFPSIKVMDNDITGVIINASISIGNCSLSDCQEKLVFTGDISSFAGANLSYNSDETELIFTGNFSNENMTAILRNVEYQNKQSEFTTDVQYVYLSVSDGHFISEKTVMIDLIEINDHIPVVDLDTSDGSITLDYATQFIEDSSGTNIAPNPSIIDQDSGPSLLDSITLTILNPLDDPHEFLLATAVGDVTVFPSNGGPSIMLIGPADISDFEAALSLVRFKNYEDNPTEFITRIIQVTANDGSHVSSPSYATVTIHPVNDPPSLYLDTNINSTLTFMEDSSAVLLSPNAQLTDPDSVALRQVSFRIINSIDKGFEYLLPPVVNGLSVAENNQTSLVLVGFKTISTYLSVIRGIRYLNNASDPTEGERLVSVVVSDGDKSVEAFALVTVVLIRDPPAVSISPEGITFTENGPAIAVFPGEVNIIDSDSFALFSAVIEITNPMDDNNEYLYWNGSSEYTIVGNFTHYLVVERNTSKELFADALSSVYYQNLAKEPSSVQRSIRLIVSNGNYSSSPVYVTVEIELVNVLPEVLLDAFGNTFVTIFYIEESGAVSILDTSAQITDEDGDLISHMEVALGPVLDSQLESLTFLNVTDALILQMSFDFSLSLLTYNFSFQNPTHTSTYTQLLRSLKYQNLALEPDDSSPREIVITVNDETDYSIPVTVTVNITLLNDNQPEFYNSTYSFSVQESVPGGSSVGTVEAFDADEGDTFHYVLLTENVPFVIQELSGEIKTSNELDREEQSVYTMKIGLSLAQDPISLFNAEALVTITVKDVNEPPFFNDSNYVFTVPENATIGTQIGTIVAIDVDSGPNAELNYSVVPSLVGVELKTGVLFVNAKLDRETTPTFTVSLVATDNGDQPLTGQTKVELILSDVNDNAPIFSQSQYHVQLVEDTGVSTTVVIVAAEDADTGSNAEVSFSISDQDDVPFAINKTSGAVYTVEVLTPDNFTILVVARDGGSPQQTSMALLLINVFSVESVLPRFTQPVYKVSLPENATIGTYITTISAMDPFSNASLMYFLNSTVFSVNSTTGEIFTNIQLDRESQSVYTIDITARSSDNREGVAELVVMVIDVNDFPPKFAQDAYSFFVSEDASIGQVVGQIAANDVFDEGENALITGYSLKSSSFAINSNGTITVASKLDREEQAEHSFEGFAVDGGNPSLTGSTIVTVAIGDVNDNAPMFSKDLFLASSLEEVQQPLFVLNVTAFDADEGLNAKISYSTNSAEFSIGESTGEVYTNIVLDFEEESSYSFTVFARDGGSPTLNASVTVQVNVIDVDDTPPHFNQSEYFVKLVEELPPSTHIIKLVAVDSDSNNSAIVYSIVEGDQSKFFTVDPSSGDLFIAEAMDRESSVKYSVTVSAHSGNIALSATTTVTVTVTDINDNRPVFLNQPVSFRTLENVTANTTVGMLQATDYDEGTNAAIGLFSILNGSDVFAVDPDSGVITVIADAVIDREESSSISLMVIVHDLGSPELTGSTEVVIYIDDVNDNAPEFDRTNYEVSVMESSLLGTSLLILNATDADEGKNSVLEYNLITPGTSFSVNSTSGQLVLEGTLDFETEPFHYLTIEVSDKGTPSLSATTNITITVMDSDDNPPYFQPSTYFASVVENSAIGEQFSKVFAKDDDTVHVLPITYSILDQDVPFSVGASTGQLTVKELLDREVKDSYTISVQAKGYPEPAATAVVTIEITDVNDFVPTFTNSTYTFLVSESNPVNSSIGKLSVFDKDLEENGVIKNVFIDPLSQVFSIDNETYGILLKSALDHELTQDYIFSVFATDGGSPPLTGSTTVRIYVTDDNDNIPQILSNATALSISEDTEAFTIISTVQATDLDSGSNGMVEFSLTNGELPIAINTSTGEIYTLGSLVPGNYSFTVIASDQGSPAKSSSLDFTVVVFSVAQPPSFLMDVYTVSILESASIGASITTVTAFSPDDALLTYSLVHSDNFTVNKTSGEISLLKMLDREHQDFYEISVLVTDSSDPKLTASALLRIEVTDVNDNRPVFAKPDGYLIQVSEDEPVGTTVITVNATDADIGANGKITYFLSFPVIAQSGLFAIGSSSGALTIKKSLDREEFTNIQIEVLALDGGTPSLSQSVIVNITLLDADDNPPVFSKSSYIATVSESISLGTAILNVSAHDLDIGNNATIRYRLIADDVIPFSIDTESGSLNIIFPGLDREKNASYSFRIEAFNPNSDVHTAVTMVSIMVTDINDNYPVFVPSGVYTFEPKEDLGVGDTVGFILAMDSDEGKNSDITYSLVTTNETQYLNVDSTTGELYLIKLLDFEDYPSLTFRIIARDDGSPSLSIEGTVTINIINVNDVAPLVTSNASSFTFKEESPPITVGTGLNITDEDGLEISIVTVMLTLMDRSPLSDQDFITLNPLLLPPLTAETNEHFINITGPADVSLFTKALQGVQFGNNADEPSLITRVITVQVNDGLFNSNALELYVNMEAINDHPPDVDLKPGAQGNDISVTYKEDEDDTLFIVPENAVITDIDIGDDIIVNGSATLLETLDDSFEFLSAESTGSVEVSILSPSEVRFVGEASIDEFLGALKTLSYTNNADQPSNFSKARTVEIVVNDGQFSSPPSYIYITVVATNDPPVLTTFSQILNYTETDSSIPVFDTSLELDDVDSSTLAYITISLLDQQKNTEYFIYSTEGTNITVQASSEGLRFNGPASIDDFTDVLLTLNYTNTLVNESLLEGFSGSRRIQVIISDGLDISNVYEIVVTFSGINDRPIVDLNGDQSPGFDNTVMYYEEGGPIRIAPLSTVVDVDSSLVHRAVIKLSNRPDEDKEMLYLSGDTDIESYYNSTNGELIINGSATTTVYQQLIRSILYNNTHSEPSTEIRTISVSVYDESSFSSLVHVMIEVIGVNDPPELILNQTGKPFVEEGVAVGFVDSVQITDIDSSKFASLHANIFNAVDLAFEKIIGYSDFTEDVTIELDSEDKVRRYTFALKDGTAENFENLLLSLKYSNTAPEPSDDSRRIEIYINDGEDSSENVAVMVSVALVNDNPPVFNANNENPISVPENTIQNKVIYTVQVSDNDVDSILQYNIHNNESLPFAINSSTGDISVTGSLDRETVSLYNISIIASDGLNEVEFKLILNIGDINDNAPTYRNSLYEVFTFENESIGTSLLLVNASDEDIGINARIEYQLNQQGDNVFTINHTTGEISLNKQLDYEIQTLYNLTVTATDFGSPTRLSATAIILVKVGNVNDNPPVFVMTEEEIKLSEDTENGTFIVSVSAIDPDGGFVTYQIMDVEEGLFSINKTSGDLYLIGELDRELEENYTLNILATDSQTPVQSTSHALLIIVTDVDDNAPLFSVTQYSIGISENINISTPLVQLQWTDEDKGLNAEATFAITSGNKLNSFTVNSDGELLVTGLIDREETPSYLLTVTVTGVLNPMFNSSALVNITVIDENDFVPSFEDEPVTFTVKENAAIGTLVGTVMAVDKDTGSNAELNYSIFGENASDIFVLDSEGELRINGSLDLETLGVQIYQLTVLAYDRGKPQLTGSGTIVVNIEEVNEFSPIFTSTESKFDIPENSPSGTYVTIITAEDKDFSKIASTISYSILNNEERFVISSSTGVLRTNKIFDFELGQTEFIITIVATDNGLPSRSSLMNITVTVDDVNEFDPVFTELQYSVSVAENATLGTTILSVHANDDDGGDTGIVFYRLLGDSLPFNVTEEGDVTVESSLDRELVDTYNFTVEAYNPFTSLDEEPSSSVPISITTSDVNDNPPVFPEPSLSTIIPSSLPIGFIVHKAIATDIDIEENAVVKYSLKSNSNIFSIDEFKGIIRIATNPLPEGIFTVTVSGVNIVTPFYEATFTITITIVAPYSVSFSNQGPGFLTDDQNSTSSAMDLFVNQPYGSTGSLSAQLAGTSTSGEFTVLYPPAVSVSGKSQSRKLHP